MPRAPTRLPRCHPAVPWRRWVPLALLGLLLWRGPSVAEPSAPTLRDRIVSQRIALYLENVHIRGKPLDDAASGRIFESYLRALDPLKVYFRSSDVAEFARDRDRLDDKLKAGELDFAERVFRRFLQRVEENTKRVDELLAMEHDFTVDEYFETGREDAKYPSTDEEVQDLWRRRIKFQLLEKLAAGETLETARKETERLFHDFQKRMRQTDTADLLEIYLTAATTTYDPHTTYMSPDTLENFQISMRLELEGIGAALQTIDGFAVVTQIIPGGAASKDGRLKPHDKVLAVGEGEAGEFVDVHNMKLMDVVKRIRGEKGTVVRLRIEHADTGEKETIALERATVLLEDYDALGEVFKKEGEAPGKAVKVGVIDLPSFYMDLSGPENGAAPSKSTARDVEEVLARFRKEGVEAVVIDLRLNGGGALAEAIDVTGLFVDTGPIVQIKGPGGQVERKDDLDPGVAWDGPLVVLTSRFSASASEIFAGAIQDYRRGLVVGDASTHGKGTVQQLVDLDGGASTREGAPSLGAIKITISQFYRPSGKSTQNRGVIPDIELPSLRSHLDSGEAHLEYAIEYDTVPPVRYDKFPLLDEALVRELARRSRERVSTSDGFRRENEEIARYMKLRDRGVVPLERSKFEREFQRSREGELEARAAPAPEGGERKVERDFYLEEVLAITRDYVLAMETR